MSNSVKLIKQILLGIVLASILAAPYQANAQFATFDASAFAQHAAEYLKDAERWIQTVQHYTESYEKLVQQLTTMKGVLKEAEQLVGMNRQAIATLASIGRTIRGVFLLKNMIESTVRTQIRSIQRIKDRLNNGLFDPQQDWQDFEEYLHDSIGRGAQDSIANSERLARMDNEYDRLRTDLQIARERLARANEDLIKNLQWLKAETERDAGIQSAEAIQTYNQTINSLRALIVQLQSEITRLESAIEEKVKRYGVRLEAEENFGQEIQNTTEAWRKTTDIKADILNKLDRDYWKTFAEER